MRLISKIVFILVSFFLIVGFLSVFQVLAQSDSDRLQSLEEEIRELEKKIAEAVDRKRTLANEISYMDSQIRLTQLQINETENKIAILDQEIASLSGKIEKLEMSLTELSRLLLERIAATYKKGRISSFELLFSARDFSDFLTRFKYVQAVQLHDKKLMFQIQEAKDTFSEKKQQREEKKAEQEEAKKQLVAQRNKLNEQKKNKEEFLRITKNDEATYQKMLAAARAEFEALQAIMAGYGEEVEVRNVNDGEKIASVIEGASCNSTGTHLHFMVTEKGEVRNPFDYLRSGINFENDSGGDPFNPRGDWNWPLSEPIIFTQGYGNTWAINQHLVWYTFHNGIDIVSKSSLDVKATKKGKLFRGIYTGNNGCKLRYVRVDHDDSDLDTIYAHVNYF